MCRPKGVSGGTTAGFPLPGWAVPSSGTVRVAVLFVDFPDAAAQHSTQRESALKLQETEERLKRYSYGKLDIEFGVLHGWLRAEQSYQHYLTERPTGGVGLGSDIAGEAVRLADDSFDFAGYQQVMVVAPSSHFGGGIAPGGVTTDEGPIGRSAVINSENTTKSKPHTTGISTQLTNLSTDSDYWTCIPTTRRGTTNPTPRTSADGCQPGSV